MRWYRKILRILYEDHVSNEEGRAKIQLAIGPHEDLLTIVKRRKLQWYGHVCRSSGQVKNILQGTVRGGKKARQTEEEIGRQHQGMDRPGVRQVQEGAGKQRKTGFEGGRGMVVKSSVVPQRPSRLRDRWRYNRSPAAWSECGWHISTLRVAPFLSCSMCVVLHKCLYQSSDPVL